MNWTDTWQKMKRPLLFAIFIFAALLVNHLITSPDKTAIRLDGGTMGTSYHIVYLDDNNRKYKRQVDSLLKVVNQSMSTYIDASLISRINQSTDTSKQITVDKHFQRVFQQAKEVYELSNGYFDPTVEPLVSAWGFGKEEKKKMDSTKVDSLLQLIGMDKFQLQKQRQKAVLSKKHPQAKLDFSAIAKGYGVDVISEFLEARGIDNYLVEIGGELRCRGKNQNEEWWRVGVDKPVNQTSTTGKRELQFVVELRNKSLATSGNYRNFYIENGRKYAHTINPKTGWPQISRLLSASVFSKSCMEADAWATAYMVMGREKSWNDALGKDNIATYLIYQDSTNEQLQSQYSKEVGEWLIKE